MTKNKSHINNSTYSMDKQSAKEYDKNGYFLVANNPISKSGVFEYAGRNITDAPEPDKMYKVYRPESELNNPDTINSFKLIPIIDEHEMLGKDATPAERKGMHGVTGEDVYFKDNILYSNLKVHSESLKDKINNGKKELSCGFYNDWTKQSGTYKGETYEYIQTNIKANHLALVDAGRMGKDVAVLDGKDKINKKGITMDEELKKYLDDIISRLSRLEEMEKKEEEGEIEVSEDEEIEVSEDMKPDEKSEDECNSEDEKSEDKKSEDAEVEKKDKKEEKAMDSKEHSFDAEDFKKQIRKEFADKQKLHDQLKQHIGSFDHMEMNVNDVAVYGASKLGISCDAKDALATVNGYLAAAKVERQVASNSMDAMDGAENSVNKYLQGE